MSDQVTFYLPGTPTAKGRPRFTKTGRTYTDDRTAAAEQSVLAAWLHVAGRRTPWDGPVIVQLDFAFLPPASWPKWKQTMACAGTWPHTGKPDLDNLVKVLDGLNGVAWVDDSQIVKIDARKRYSPLAATVIEVTMLPKPERTAP